LTQKTIYIEHMSCKRRSLDAYRFSKYFEANGCKIVRWPNFADILLFMSCAFRTNEENYAINRIKKLLQYRGTLIVTGCLPGISPDRLGAVFSGLSFSPKHNHHIDAYFPNFSTSFKNIPDSYSLYPKHKKYMRYQAANQIKSYSDLICILTQYIKWNVQKAYYLRISNGCPEPHCAYCRIWKATGALHSKRPVECETELNKALKNGFRNIVLVAENIGAYGSDINETLPCLLKRLCNSKKQFTIAIQSLRPDYFLQYQKELLSIFATGRISKCGTAIQSGSQKIINDMNRYYDIKKITEVVKNCKQLFPHIQIDTHIIIGFPTETEDDLKATLRCLKETPFDLVCFFAYGHNQHITDKRLLKNLIDSQTIANRMKLALDFCKKNGIAAIRDSEGLMQAE